MLHGHQSDAEAIERIPGWGTGTGARLLFGIAVAFSAFQLWTSAYAPLPSQVVRSVHVGFLMLLLFGLLANGARSAPARALWWSLAGAAFALGFYHWFFYHDLVMRSGLPTAPDLVAGVAVTALVFLAGQRMMGWSLPLICALFLLYGLFGQWLPSPFNHRGYAFEQVVDTLFLSTEGLYGTPI